MHFSNVANIDFIKNKKNEIANNDHVYFMFVKLFSVTDGLIHIVHSIFNDFFKYFTNAESTYQIDFPHESNPFLRWRFQIRMQFDCFLLVQSK